MIVSCTLSDFVGYEEFNSENPLTRVMNFSAMLATGTIRMKQQKRMHFNSYFTSNSKSDNHLSIKSP